MNKKLELYFIINKLLNEIDFNHPQAYQIITEEQIAAESKDGNYKLALLMFYFTYIECLIHQSIGQNNELNKKLLWAHIQELKIQADQEGKEVFNSIVYCLKNQETQNHFKGKIAKLFFQVVFS